MIKSKSKNKHVRRKRIREFLYILLNNSNWKSQRELVEERNLNVFFLIDVSSSMVYGSIDKLKIEYVAELAAALSYVVLNAGDSVGFALFNDKIVKNIFGVRSANLTFFSAIRLQ